MRVAIRAWGRLLRLSLAPTAAADVLAGALFAAAAGGIARPGAGLLALAIAGSLCVYHANMALNDWHDRRADAATRPDRPLVSGAISPRAALSAVIVLGALGVLLAGLAAPLAGLWLAGVGALAGFYNLAGRGPWSGPLLLGACRGGNLGLGIVLVGLERVPAITWAAPLLYAGYVFVVSRLGRLEDSEDPLYTGDSACTEDRNPSGARPRRHLCTAGILLIAVAFLPLAGANFAARVGALVLASLAAAGLFARARSVVEWTPAAVGASMGLALRRMLVFSSACALLTGTSTGLLASGAILLGYPLSYALRNAFPPS